MKRNHIVFLTHYFPPEVNAPANRTFEHAKEWISEIDVTIVTNFPNHPDGKIFPGYKNRLLQKEIIDGINVVRLWTFITPNEGIILRTLNYVIFMLAAIVYVVFSRIKFDLIVATTPQFFCGLAGKWISKIKRKPFILELRDLWPESIIAVGALKNRLLIKTLERTELNLYKAATRVVSVTSSFKSNLISRGIDPDKIDVIFNGVSVTNFTNGKEISNKELKKFLDDGFKCGYIGTIGMAHSIGTLIRAAEKLKDTPIKFVIVGSGAERERLEKEIAEKGLKNIKIFPIQSKSEIASIINKIDLFCVHLKNEPLFKTVIPSKLFEGMIMKKPILIGVNGEARKIVESARGGLYFEPENYQDLIDKIGFYYNNTEYIKSHGENGYRFVLEKFDRIKLAADFLNIIKCLLNENPQVEKILDNSLHG
ncbi:MAG: glycosyltransferase family 4 protein [Bacteroidota bacterium]|nr:glycosyltransferase family 4 protein [Bacteroidota bacterium]